MTVQVAFEVIGHPEPAGSKKAVQLPHQRRPYVVDANPKAKGWQKVVAATARGAMLKERLEPFTGPLFVEMVFQRVRPVSHVRRDGSLSLEGTRHPWPETKPDVLKLARAVEDAMTGIVYVDDALIVSERLAKEYRDHEGVRILVMPL